MATAAYYGWVRRGRPFTLARPIADVVAWARANDVPVLGTIGNEAHLTKDRPEDHTPFSYTEWPVPLDGDIVCAVDLKNVRLLGAKIEAQARGGKLPWLKYMNHSGRHIDFRGPRPVTSTSSDEHVHLSIRTDWASRSIGQFNPFGIEEKDVNLSDPVKLITGGEVDYSGDETTVGGVLASTNYYVLQSRNSLGAELAKVRAELAELAARPAVQIDRATLVDVLTEVIGKVDGK